MLRDPARSAWKVIQEPAEFKALAEKAAGNERILGVMRSYSTSQVARAGHDDNIRDDAPYETPRRSDVPPLADMALGAINVLKGGDGFFLMIEGGAIDWAGHKQTYGRMIEEVVDFNEAIAAVIDWVNREGDWNNTLLVITADHETGRLSGPDGAREVGKRGQGRAAQGRLPDPQPHQQPGAALCARSGCGHPQEIRRRTGSRARCLSRQHGGGESHPGPVELGQETEAPHCESTLPSAGTRQGRTTVCVANRRPRGGICHPERSGAQ